MTAISQTNFEEVRNEIIGINSKFTTPFGTFPLIYADWIASGRLYGPIEDAIAHNVGPWVANTHSYSNKTGSLMTTAYSQARDIIRNHVNANEDDICVLTGTGMTGGVIRLQQILGLCKNQHTVVPEGADKPVVFITHIEHHSNHVSWMETIADVVIVPPNDDLTISTEKLQESLEQYADRKTKIGAFSAGSNVTGIIAPVHELAEVMHKNNGLCLIDYAATAPYVDINMHPDNELQALDAVYFSPHKFLGGPGSCGVMLFNKKMYKGQSCVPGGGNVTWTNPWGGYGFTANNEAKEDGGTPGFIQAIKAAMAIKLKDKMGTDQIEIREEELIARTFDRFDTIDGLQIVGETKSKRIGVVSFNIKDIHYNMVVRILNDRFGIQVRGGWACASTYAHYLFDMDTEFSQQLTAGIDNKDMTGKPGWARLSLHPTMTDDELDYVLDAIEFVANNKEELKKDYTYDPSCNDFVLQKESVSDNEVEAAKMFEI